MVDLYLKINKPAGKRFYLRNPATGAIDYSKVYILYPDKPVKAPEALLEQDPHLVSKKPFKGKVPATQHDHNLGKVKIAVKDENPVDVVEEIMDGDVTSMTAKVIHEYANRLGFKIPATLKKDEKAGMLLEKCQEILSQAG